MHKRIVVAVFQIKGESLVDADRETQELIEVLGAMDHFETVTNVGGPATVIDVKRPVPTPSPYPMGTTCEACGKRAKVYIDNVSYCEKCATRYAENVGRADG